MTRHANPGSSTAAALVQDVRWGDGCVTVDVAGEINMSRSADFQRQMLALIERKPRRMVVNFRGVTYMDSSGLASMIKLLSHARRAGTSLVLEGLRDRVRSIFEITRLSNVFDISPPAREVTS